MFGLAGTGIAMNNFMKKQSRNVVAKKLFGVWMLLAACVGMGTVQAQTVEYIHTDALGTPVAVTDVNRTVIERSEYEPYGALLNRPISDGPGYTGHVMDAVTGLTYMQQRYYDPTLGRFLSVDPVTADGNTGGNFNRYWYANNNPYKFTDPDGRFVLQAGGAAGGAVIGVIATAVGDLARGEMSSGGTYAGAAAGGASAGIVLTTTGNPALAGAAGGAVGSAVQQGIDNGVQNINVADVATGAVVGGVLGAVPGVKVPGITSGRNSFSSVAKAAQTKLGNGTISSVSPKTMMKSAVASGVGGSAGAAVGDTGSRGVTKGQEAVRGALQGIQMPKPPSLPGCVAKACAGK